MKQLENQKDIQIDDFIMSLKGSNIKTVEQFQEFRNLAISKDGLLNNIYRRILYQKLFSIDSSKKGSYTFLIMDNSSSHCDVIIQEKKQDLIISKKFFPLDKLKQYEHITQVDADRTIINQIKDNQLEL